MTSNNTSLVRATPISGDAGQVAHWPLWALLVAAVVVRFLWRMYELPILQGPECEYVRLAQTLFGTGNYVGLTPGPQLLYPPLLPLLIGFVSPLTSSFEAAAGLITLLSGGALVVAVFGLARLVYGWRTGVVAATLSAFHPVLIQLSGVVYSEVVFNPLLVGGVLFCLRWLDAQRLGSAVLCGACFGLAYLARPEALFLSVLIVAAFVSSRLCGLCWIRVVTGSLSFVATVAILATPYVVYLSSETGGLRIEGKSVMNYTIADRINSGMSVREAEFGLGPDLREFGPHLSPNEWIASAPSAVPLGALATYWMISAERNFRGLRWTVLSAQFGAELMLVLVAVGLLGPLWSRRRFVCEAVIVSVVVSYVVLLLGQHEVALRFTTPLLPFLIIWMSHGIRLTAGWLADAGARIARQKNLPIKWVGVSAQGVLVAALVMLATHGLTRAGNFRSAQPHELYRKDAGQWLAHVQAGPKKVMSTSDEVAYYAGATELRFPYASAKLALAYIRAKSPDYIVLTREPSPVGGYYVDWLEHGIPDPAAHLVHQIGPPGNPQAVMYAWRPAQPVR